MKLKIRDSYAVINGDDTEFICESRGLSIIGEDNRTLFDIYLKEDGSIVVTSGEFCKVNNEILDTCIYIDPKSVSSISIRRPKWEIK